MRVNGERSSCETPAISSFCPTIMPRTRSAMALKLRPIAAPSSRPADPHPVLQIPGGDAVHRAAHAPQRRRDVDGKSDDQDHGHEPELEHRDHESVVRFVERSSLRNGSPQARTDAASGPRKST